MNVKRYIANDVTEAVEKIRSELGRDAFILSTRKIRQKGIVGFFRKPKVEVVAAYDMPEAAAKYKSAQAAAAAVPDLPPVARFTPPPNVVRPVKPVDVAQPAAPDTSVPVLSPGSTPFTQSELEDLLTGKKALGTVAPKQPLPRQDEEKIRALEEKIDGLSTTLNALAGKIQINKSDYRSNYNANVAKLVLSLLENDVHEEFAHKVAREVNEIVEKQSEDAREVMEQILKQYIGEAAPIKLKRFKRTVVILVGPTGVGKTTTLAKLAAIYSINHHARVGIITTDNFRIAAVEQLKTYAEILEVPLGVVYSLDEVSDALREHEDKDIVFIDTAGRSPNDESLEPEITKLVKQAEADEVHLVMSATTSFTGCLNVVKTYSFLRDYKLLITKFDETPTWGMALNMRFMTDRPISYMAFGQTVPDDIEVSSPVKLINKLIGRHEQ